MQPLEITRDRATLHLKDGRTLAFVLPQDPAARGELSALLSVAGRLQPRTFQLATPDGGAEISSAEIASVALPPPHCLVRDFLTEAEIAQATEYVLAQGDRFYDATISQPATQGKSTPDTRFRRSRILDDVHPVMPFIVPRLQAVMPEVWAKLRMAPLTFARMECQITAHGDGDFFDTHTDNGLPDIAHRRMSFVYYLHKEPKRFSGGHLRLYDTVMTNGAATCGPEAADIDPPRNGLMIFPTFIFHEVTPIQSTAPALEDQRLTINGWLI